MLHTLAISFYNVYMMWAKIPHSIVTQRSQLTRMHSKAGGGSGGLGLTVKVVDTVLPPWQSCLLTRTIHGTFPGKLGYQVPLYILRATVRKNRTETDGTWQHDSMPLFVNIIKTFTLPELQRLKLFEI